MVSHVSDSVNLCPILSGFVISGVNLVHGAPKLVCYIRNFVISMFVISKVYSHWVNANFDGDAKIVCYKQDFVISMFVISGVDCIEMSIITSTRA